MRNLCLLFLVALTTGFIGEKKIWVSSQSPVSDDLYLEGRTSGDLPIDDEDGDDDEDGSGSGSGDYGFTDTSDKEEVITTILNFTHTTVSKGAVPVQPQPSTASPRVQTTTAADSHVQRVTGKTKPTGDDEKEEAPAVRTTSGKVTERTSTRSTTSTPRETTKTTVSVDVVVNKESEEDNSLDRWDATTPKLINEDVIEREIDNEVWAKGRMINGPPEQVTSENLWERTEVLAAVIACGVVGFLCAVFLLLLLAYRMKKKDEGSYDLGDTKLSTTAYHKAPTKEFYA